jgi:hypothetical protein
MFSLTSFPSEIEYEICSFAMATPGGGIDVRVAATLRLLNKRLSHVIAPQMFSFVTISKPKHYRQLFEIKGQLCNHITALQLECIPKSDLVADLWDAGSLAPSLQHLCINTDAIGVAMYRLFSQHRDSWHSGLTTEYLKPLGMFLVRHLRPTTLRIMKLPGRSLPHIDIQVSTSQRSLSTYVIYSTSSQTHFFQWTYLMPSVKKFDIPATIFGQFLPVSHLISRPSWEHVVNLIQTMDPQNQQIRGFHMNLDEVCC